MKKAPFSAAVLLPGDGLSRQTARILRDLEALRVSPTLFRLRLPGRGPGLVYPAYRALDRLLFRSAVDPFSRDPLPPGDLPVDLPAPPHWPGVLARQARERGLEVLIVPGRLPLPRDVLEAFPLGALVLDHLDFVTGDAPGAFAAVAQAAPDWETRLAWQAAGHPPRVLASSPSAVFPLSLRHTAAPACAKAACFAGRALRELAARGPGAWEKRAEPMTEPAAAALPGDPAMLRFLPRLLGRHLRAALRDAFFKPQWFLAQRRDGGDPLDPSGYTPLFPPGTGGWADPFPFVHQGAVHLFFEDIHPVSGLGRIAVMTRDAHGHFGPPRTVLERPHHLSYPFVFEWGGEAFMVPESSQAGRVELFRAARFPWEWESAGVLLDGVRAVDATLFEHDGRWWMMVNLREEGASSWDELFAFHADSPLGKFVPHPGNPVVSDVRRARPAGRVFSRGGRLFRPAQDCSGHYGRALVINEILTLTPDDYRETVAARHDAAALGIGDSLHTYNAVPGLEVVDGRRYVPRLRLFGPGGMSGGRGTPRTPGR